MSRSSTNTLACGDEVVLGGEQPVQGRGGDLGLGSDPVDPDTPDPIPAEQVMGDGQDVVSGDLLRTTVQDITGRPSRTFEQWARAHVGAFT